MRQGQYRRFLCAALLAAALPTMAAAGPAGTVATNGAAVGRSAGTRAPPEPAHDISIAKLLLSMDSFGKRIKEATTSAARQDAIREARLGATAELKNARALLTATVTDVRANDDGTATLSHSVFAEVRYPPSETRHLYVETSRDLVLDMTPEQARDLRPGEEIRVSGELGSGSAQAALSKHPVIVLSAGARLFSIEMPAYTCTIGATVFRSPCSDSPAP